MPEPEPKLEACGMCMRWVCDVCPSLNACVIERIVRATSFYVFGRVDAWIAGLLTQDFRKQLRSLGTIGLLLRDAVRFYFIAMALALVLHPATPQGCSGTRAEAGGIGLRTNTNHLEDSLCGNARFLFQVIMCQLCLPIFFGELSNSLVLLRECSCVEALCTRPGDPNKLDSLAGAEMSTAFGLGNPGYETLGLSYWMPGVTDCIW